LFATRLATSARRAPFGARRPAGRMDRVPARSDRRCLARRSLVRRARRARPPPFVPHGTASASPRALRARWCWLRFRAPSVLRWDYRARVGRDPAATPVHSTDVCCSRILFSRNFQGCCPSLDARHSTFPTRWGSSRFTPSEPASVSRRAARSVVFSGIRRAGVPLMPRRPAGTPGGAASTGVGPQSYAFAQRPRVVPKA
jgi:hypothetical protein